MTGQARPLASIVPAMNEEVEQVNRLRIAEEASGCIRPCPGSVSPTGSTKAQARCPGEGWAWNQYL